MDRNPTYSWNQLMIPVIPGQESALHDWARIKYAFA